MIPKKIHYCWFGRGEKPRLAKKCIASWREFCPDYEIVEWNEDNFDVDLNAYTRMCYEQKKYAFLSDYVRLLVVNEHGGLYFDTDVEVVRSLDELLSNKAFFGFETKDFVNTGQGFGAESNVEIVERLTAQYDSVIDGKHGVIGCPLLNTKALVEYGFKMNGELQRKNGIVVFPNDYFNPFNDNKGVLTKTNNTYSIHWYGKSWMGKKYIFRNKLTRILHRFMGEDFFHR